MRSLGCVQINDLLSITLTLSTPSKLMADSAEINDAPYLEYSSMTWLLLYAQAFASTITVGGASGDYPSIQEAIDNSLDGDVINVSTGTYNESLLFDGRELSILGNQSTLAPINSNDTVRWLNGANVEISDFHILPNTSRAFYSVNSSASVKNSTVSNSGNLNTLNGGTIYVDAGSFDLTEVIIDTSSGQWGGTVYAINAAQLEWNQVEITTSSGEYGGTFYLDESVLVASDLSIDDTQANFSGGGLYLIDSEVTLNEFELNNCQGDQTWGAGIYATGTLLTINDGLISSCKALDFLSGYGGGAIYATSASTLDFFDVYLSDSTAYFGGGMALGWTTNASLVNFTAFDNRANNIGNTALGGALFIGPTANVACTNCSFLDNEADQGGAIAIESGGLFSDEAGVYTSNQATNAGGAVYFENTVDASFTQTRFEKNGSGTGGAAYIAGSSLAGAQFSEVNFIQNTALNGGGALSLLGSSEITISNSNFENNTSDTVGGAIQCTNTNGSIHITDSRLEYNVATTLGGAIYSSSADGVVLERLTFRENASGSNGGAWYHNTGQASASLSLWLTNRSPFGGAIAIEQSSLDTKLINNSFVENLAYSEGAHLWIAGGEIVATNNIYAFGLGGGGLYADTASMNSQLSYGDAWANIDGDYIGSLIDPTGSSGNISGDPLFRDYLPGGTEEDDLHLASGSPCVNAGDPTLLAPDLSRSDIGAYGGQNATTKDDDLDGFLDLVDCDDQDASINPNATEIAYDGIDQDCDGGDLRDIDLDSYEAATVGGDDCDDTKSSVNPGASETYYDGVDQNCDGLSDFDADHDAEDASVFGGLDCDDTNDQINSLAIETLYDGIDQNCDGRSDFDGDRDGYDSDNYGGLDCDDTRNDVYPGATEVPLRYGRPEL